MIKPAFNPGNIGYGAEIILLRTKQDLTTFWSEYVGGLRHPTWPIRLA
jgi:hypothetical protein